MEDDDDDKEFDEEDDGERGPGMSLKILALSILRDNQCGVLKLIQKYYVQNFSQVNNLFLYVAVHWNKLIKNTPEKRRQELTQELMDLSNHLIKINNKLYENTYVNDEGKSVSTPKLGLDLQKIETATATCIALQKSLQKSATLRARDHNKGRSTIQKLILMVVVVVGIFYFFAYE